MSLNNIKSEVYVKKNSTKRNHQYNPNVGFIGSHEVKVSNYLFSALKARKAYDHARPVVERILNNEVKSHYNESKKLTKFLKNRDLTFSKKTSKGYQTFTVPCTTTVVPLQKSLFNDVEKSAQRLIISLRKVLQDIYGAKSLRESEFINSLPENVKNIFIEAVETSGCYYPQLHHKNMKDYPFFDNVGLDLVLVEDYIQKSNDFPNLIAKKKENELPGLPFRILELNAGSPSGASNNMNMLEGIYNQNPEILESLGKVMPNDHFKVLGETYKSLGENWTGITDGVQIILPPGGSNGAAPEIHQLAAFSGLIYADSDQLYRDSKGYIRLRTVAKKNPIVTAIYSRINSDSALFDVDKGLILKDPDSGESIYLKDYLKFDKNNKPLLIKDHNGNPIPLESSYAIPGAIDAIINKKLYMGGLNRILDNKIILATLTHYSPKFYADEITKLGLDPKGTKILPPQTLPPTLASAKIIANDPDEWVVKAPNLAGGQGVYILKTLPLKQKKEIINMILKRPSEFAYQQLVKIARIPVAVERKNQGYRFANLAADIRIWVFYGGEKDALPKMTHNALVRYAPHEKGKMSSIVNTSAGGGYAPFVILDDTNSKEAVSAKKLVEPKKIQNLTCELPVFVGAQLVQISRVLKELNNELNTDNTSSFRVQSLLLAMKSQLKEVLSFLHPRSIEPIYNAIDLLEAKTQKSVVSKYFTSFNNLLETIVHNLSAIESKSYALEVKEAIDSLRVLDINKSAHDYTDEMRDVDTILILELKSITKKYTDAGTEERKNLNQLIKVISKHIELEFPRVNLNQKAKASILNSLNAFCQMAKERLSLSNISSEFIDLLSLNSNVSDLCFETLYLGNKDDDKEIMVATQNEYRTKKSLLETDYVSDELKDARKEWMSIQAQAKKIKASLRGQFLSDARSVHFRKYPILADYQRIIESRSTKTSDLIKLLDAVPYAKFNIEKFAQRQGLKVEDIFSTKLEANKLSILSSKELKELNLCSRDYAGECFAKKRRSNGLYSESDIFVWLRAEINPFILLYTAGHELIHYNQILESMNAEKRALKDGGVSLAKSLNYYGNFLGSNMRSLESIQNSSAQTRKPLYGYADKVFSSNSKIINEFRASLQKSDLAWEKSLNKYGSVVSYMMPNAIGTKVKALQEVLPALENAKNIQFATQLGLEVNLDPVQSALPAANTKQIKQYKGLILNAVNKTSKDWEALRIIANHQYHGISFCRADIEEKNLTLAPTPSTISMGASYNQTQQ